MTWTSPFALPGAGSRGLHTHHQSDGALSPRGHRLVRNHHYDFLAS